MKNLITPNSRLRLFEIWNKVKRGETLEGEEKTIGELLLQHAEFRQTWDTADQLADKEFDADDVNPFMHITIDTIVMNQIDQGTPIEVKQAYERLRAGGMEHLDALHEIDRAFINELWPVLKHDKPFNEKRYKKKVQKL
jgi:hypothetical protein